MHDVVFAPEALADLIALYDYIAERSSPERAFGYIDRIEATCRSLETLPERGTRRDDIRPGLRLIVHGSRVSIAFNIDRTTVTVLRILYGGRDLSIAFDES